MLRTYEVRTTVARPHLRQSCNSASLSSDSPAREHKTIVGASFSCLMFSENLHEVCNFVCDPPHGLMPAANPKAKWSYDWCETGLKWPSITCNRLHFEEITISFFITKQGLILYENHLLAHNSLRISNHGCNPLSSATNISSNKRKWEKVSIGKRKATRVIKL